MDSPNNSNTQNKPLKKYETFNIEAASPSSSKLAIRKNNPKKSIFAFKNKENDLPDREIQANIPVLDFPDNSISTSKYNILTFLPKNLWEQFSKMANIYFLIIGLMQMIPQISISDNLPVIYLPLAVIVIITAVKDLLEDLKRKRSDNEENSRYVKVLRNGILATAKWQTLRVGEIIRVEQNEYFPCDVLIIATSDSKGICYIETKNLDGETNLKHKQANNSFLDFYSSEKELINSNFMFIYEKLNPYLYTFTGTVELDKYTKLPCDNQNFVLRGCSLRNTKYIYGLVSYTGHDTKIMLNSVASKAKKSKLEKIMATQIIIIFLVQIVLCVFSAFFYAFSVFDREDEFPYLCFPTGGSFIGNFFIKIGNWILIFTNFVPISLLVTLEMVKVIQGFTISNDNQMKTLKTGINATVQSSNLNEELGQVQYIFSDKTGTLTCNEMEFKKLTVNGKPYGINKDMDMSILTPVSNVDFGDKAFYDALEDKNNSEHDQATKFMMFLALCHTIITEKKGDEIIYNASSPDEFALVNFAKYLGFEYIDKNKSNQLIIKRKDEYHAYELLHVLEFSSARKRMSVILRDHNRKISLLCKGADSVIMKRMKKDQPYLDETLQNLGEFANEGLRTLLLAEKQISENEYRQWLNKFQTAITSMTDREEKISAIQDEIEVDLHLVGATAIEDKLQDRVPDTIYNLKKAGIKVWVLTGDKMETAINIGFSCKLLDNSYNQLIVDGTQGHIIAQTMEQILYTIRSKQKYALIITGDALIQITNSPFTPNLMKIAQHCESVICCRVSPKQKQEVVSLVRSTLPEVTTLAIGDGANDVNMIVAAHVGIGIRGVEGQQAARASDFAIGEFKFLQNLLFVHGRECYRRNAHLILYNFYKNIILVAPQFFFGFYSLYSGQTLYNSFIYQFFNIFFAALPIVIYAVSDREYKDITLMENPKLYSLGLNNTLFNTAKFWFWFFFAFYQAGVLTWITIQILETNFNETEGVSTSFWLTGLIIFQGALLIANFKILLFSYKLSILLYFVIIISIGMYIIMLILLDLMTLSDYYGIMNAFANNACIYWANILSIVATLGLDYAYGLFHELKSNSLQFKLAEKEERMIENENETTREYERPVSNSFAYKGFAFSQEEKMSEYVVKQYKNQYKMIYSKHQVSRII